MVLVIISSYKEFIVSSTPVFKRCYSIRRKNYQDAVSLNNIVADMINYL